MILILSFGKNRKLEQQPNYGYNQPNPYMFDNQLQRLYYELEELNRKVRNINRRLRRVENYLQLRNEDIDDEDSLE